MCVLKRKNDDLNVVVLRIDFLNPAKNEKNRWIRANGFWIFRVCMFKCDNANYEALMMKNNKMNDCHSQQCVTMNAAAKLFHQHLRHEIYENYAKVVWTKNVNLMSEESD